MKKPPSELEGFIYLSISVPLRDTKKEILPKIPSQKILEMYSCILYSHNVIKCDY
jgi:hypothetical protein